MAKVGTKLAAAATTAVVAVPTLSSIPHTSGVGSALGLGAALIAWHLVESFVSDTATEETDGTVEPVAVVRSDDSTWRRNAKRVIYGKSRLQEQAVEHPTQQGISMQQTNDFRMPRRMATFSDILKAGYRPSLDKLYMCRVESQDIFLNEEEGLHFALAGNTGGGKSNIMRLLLAQVCSTRQASVVLLNPHYTDYDYEKDEDWTPFKPYLEKDPNECRSYHVIHDTLKDVATRILPVRLERRAKSRPVGKHIYIFIDELPAIIDHTQNIPFYLKQLLREGRKCKIHLAVASQDFLVDTIGGTGATRDCYRVAFYVGGDATTARVLLDESRVSNIPETELGKGIVMFRGGTCKKAVKAWVPFVDNAALERLLGPSTYVPDVEIEDDDDPLANLSDVAGHSDRNGPERTGMSDEHESASVPFRSNGRNLPEGWTQKEVDLAVTLYNDYCRNMDDVLKALRKPQDKKNRDAIRAILGGN